MTLADGPGSGVARVLFRIRLWARARLLPFQIRGRDFASILAMTDTNRHLPHWPVAYLERSVRWAVRAPILMRNRRCLRSGLLGYSVLKQAGYQPELLFSVENRSIATDRLAAHCWVCLDGKPVINLPLPDHVIVYRHPTNANQASAS